MHKQIIQYYLTSRGGNNIIINDQTWNVTTESQRAQ